MATIPGPEYEDIDSTISTTPTTASSFSSRESAAMKLPGQTSRQVYWRTPALMIGTLILGSSLAIGHHSYYKWLNGQNVGSTNNQQWSLRYAINILLMLYDLKYPHSIGNAFAISIALCLKTSVGIAYTQYLWKTLTSTSLRPQTIDDAFELSANVFAFLNWELAKRLRIASLAALLIWWVCPEYI
jgi:hypothetical protein